MTDFTTYSPLKTCKKLYGLNYDKRSGNHDIMIVGNDKYFKYHGTIVAYVTPEKAVICRTAWGGYPSTVRVQNSYKALFIQDGLRVIDERDRDNNHYLYN